MSSLGTDATGKIEFRQLTRDRLEEVIALQTETMKRECIAIGVGILEEEGAAEEIQSMFREVCAYGITVVGVDVEKDRVVAVAFNKLHLRPKDNEAEMENLLENAEHESCQELINFLHGIESGVNIFEKYGANCAMELAYIGTDEKYQGRGIGSEITRATVKLAKGLRSGEAKKKSVAEKIILQEAVPDIIFGVFASGYSQRIAEKLSFESLAECRYENYFSRGKKMSDRIGSTHKTARLAALKL